MRTEMRISENGVCQSFYIISCVQNGSCGFFAFLSQRVISSSPLMKLSLFNHKSPYGTKIYSIIGKNNFFSGFSVFLNCYCFYLCKPRDSGLPFWKAFKYFLLNLPIRFRRTFFNKTNGNDGSLGLQSRVPALCQMLRKKSTWSHAWITLESMEIILLQALFYEYASNSCALQNL